MSESTATAIEDAPEGVDPQVPHVPRILDYLLDGVANYAMDRQVADVAFSHWPGVPGGVEGAKFDVRAARGALGRMVRYFASVGGVSQFIDIAPGLPTMDNTHLAARSVNPNAKTVYIDSDPVVVAYSKHLLAGESESDVAFVLGDYHDPQDVIAKASKTLDFSQPIGLVLYGMLHFVLDQDEAARSLNAYLDAMAPGSFVAVSHFALDEQDSGMNAALDAMDKQFGEAVVRRSRDELAWFFKDMELLEPGVVPTDQWRPTQTYAGKPLPMWVAAARKR